MRPVAGVTDFYSEKTLGRKTLTRPGLISKRRRGLLGPLDSSPTIIKIPKVAIEWAGGKRCGGI